MYSVRIQGYAVATADIPFDGSTLEVHYALLYFFCAEQMLSCAPPLE
jgi:hypothetical protein